MRAGAHAWSCAFARESARLDRHRLDDERLAAIDEAEARFVRVLEGGGESAKKRIVYPCIALEHGRAPCRSLLPPPLAGEGWGGGRQSCGARLHAPSTSLLRKRGREPCGARLRI